MKKEGLEERKEDKAIRKKGVPEVGMLSREKKGQVGKSKDLCWEKGGTS